MGTVPAQENYLYDADGNRVKKSVTSVFGTTDTYYPSLHYEVTGSTVTKYYFHSAMLRTSFGGQRAAMRVGSTLKYLHSNHLSRTTAETNTSGTVIASQKYKAYGKNHASGYVSTNHQFTGQMQDASGLTYMNARYYDPSIGTFISADTIVPEPGIVADYNRYAYVRGRVMNATDRSGHCASFGDAKNGYRRDTSDADCWALVDHILNLWKNDKTGYWSKRYGSEGVFLNYIAPFAMNNAVFMNSEVAMYHQSDGMTELSVKQGKAIRENLSDAEKRALADPMCGGQKTCQSVVGGVEYVDQKCQEMDCVGIGNDVVGVAAGGLVLASPLCGPGVAVCAGVGTYVGYGSTAFGVGWTVYNYAEGDATNADLVTTGTLAARAVTTENPKVGLATGILQFIWDFFLSPDERW